MKKFLFIIIVVMIYAIVTACEPTTKPKSETKIEYLDTLKIKSVGIQPFKGVNYKVYFLDNGEEAWQTYESVIIMDTTQATRYEMISGSTSYVHWTRAIKGQEVVVVRVTKGPDEFGEFDKRTYYDPLPLPDYQIKRVIKKVSKFDGHMGKVDWNSETYHTRFSYSSTETGHGESMGSEDFFVNIYFYKGDPLSITGKESFLWLEANPGDTVLEERINGLLTRTLIRK